MTPFQKPPPGMGKPKGGICGATALLAAFALLGMFIRYPDRLKKAWEETRDGA